MYILVVVLELFILFYINLSVAFVSLFAVCFSIYLFTAHIVQSGEKHLDFAVRLT